MRFDERRSRSTPVVAFLLDAIPSHAFASMGLARRLQRAGYAVEFWGADGSRIEGLIRSRGLRYRPIDGLWARYRDDIRLPTHLNATGLALRPHVLLQKLFARRALRRRLPADLVRCERALDDLLQVVEPAFVVIDPFLLAYYPLLWARGIPTVVLSTKPVATADDLVPPYDSALLPPRTAAERARVRLCWGMRRTHDRVYGWLRRGARALNAYTYEDLLLACVVRSGFPLHRELVNRAVQPDMHFRSLAEWALWIPETDLPRRASLPPNVFFVGPSVDATRSDLSAPSPWRSDGTFRIYVAVGTVRSRWRENVGFLRKTVAALGGVADFQVLLSTGDERTTAALGPAPSNITVRDFVPQLDVLRGADLVITHAGAGTYRECIHYEVPMLAYPRNHDQLGNSARIVHHGIGLRGDRASDGASDIRGKAYRILKSETFRLNLRRLNAVTRVAEEPLLAHALDQLLGDDAVDPVPVPSRVHVPLAGRGV